MRVLSRDAHFSPYSLPYERDAQLTGLSASGANVVVANAVDLGDATAPFGSVHPRNKQTVGRRFAAAALDLLYGESTPYLNPRYARATAVPARGPDDTLSVVVEFDAASLSNGELTLVSASCPTSLGVPASECAWYDVQLSDGTWYNATVSVTDSGTGLVLTVAGGAGLTVNATRGDFSRWPVVRHMLPVLCLLLKQPCRFLSSPHCAGDCVLHRRSAGAAVATHPRRNVNEKKRHCDCKAFGENRNRSSY
jgi:hypothetical protein